MKGYYNAYNGLGTSLTQEELDMYNDAYLIAFNCDFTLPKPEDFANGNGEAILDDIALRAYALYPDTTQRVILDRIAIIEARNKAVKPIDDPEKIRMGGRYSPAPSQPTNTAQQAATLPTVATPPATPAKKTWKDYLPWIIVGGVVAFGAYKLLTGGKKKRR